MSIHTKILAFLATLAVFGFLALVVGTAPAKAQTAYDQDQDDRIQALEDAVFGPPPPPPNRPPIADAGPDQTGIAGNLVTFDGTGSNDLDGDPITFLWTLGKPGTSLAQFNDPTAPTPDFTPDVEGTYIASLTVNDGDLNSLIDTATATITVQAPPPPSGTFAELCADPSVVRCVDFDGAPEWDGYHDPGNPFPPAHDPGFGYEGGSMKLTVDANRGNGVTGDVYYDFPPQSGTFYVSFRIHFGNGFMTLIRSQQFGDMSGMKIVKLLPGSASCDANELVLTDTSHSWPVQGSEYSPNLTGIWNLTKSCSGSWFGSGSDRQPGGVVAGQCGSGYVIDQRKDGLPVNGIGDDPAGPCVVLTDDMWHLVTWEVNVNAAEGVPSVRLWLDGVLTIEDSTHDITVPLIKIELSNYMTGHNSGESAEFGPTWPVHYDNLIISTECLTGCTP